MKNQHLSLLSIALGASLLTGCAAPARVEQMRAEVPMAARTAAQSSALKGNLAIKEVTGGQETNPMWTSKVSSAEYERALEASLRDAGLLSANRQAGTHLITAHMLKLDQPFMGASMTVTATVQYVVIDRASGKEVYSKAMATPFTAEWNSSFLGTERLRIANEGAVRENLKRVVSDLAELSLNQLTVR